ncbi:Crp/Fnr family transcriptional regulator [Flavobacterium sp. NRK1]|nr:Crp/Fnr family transcriptional regulator [Flavobacterium sp. NRK1]
MYNNLFNYISRYTNTELTAQEEDLIKKAFAPKRLRKKQFFLQEGDVCRYTGFIIKGAMRQCCFDTKGVEQTVNFFVEDYWADERESFTFMTPSKYSIQAWEDTHLLIITREGMLELATKVPSLLEMLRTMDDRHAIANQKRVSMSIGCTAEKRYEDFAASYPQFINRFPLHQIASFLGITKETLSRVRKQSLR